ncbi:MAG TPA: hypothetical protein VNY30_07120 [Bryobacteraceae bacterium]|nr:hypothetical protein [Bryobacteraceae bacterium]
MLKSLDVLIGFSIIMLLVSAAVTVLTQVITGAFGWRGRHLVRGVVTILNQIDPKITPFCLRQIAVAALRHPLIARAEGRLGTVIQREELTRVLLELAAGKEPGGKSLDEYARATLKRVLETNGIANPAEVLDNIHLLALKLEALRPELPSPVRHTIAVVTEAPSQFAARLHTSFDETMDRVTQRFARHARLVAGAIALLVAAGLQLDAFELLRRLASDSATAYAILPQTWTRTRLPGITLSAMLLSLGAPFWYNALKDLVGLRPILARKEQAHREQRQSSRDAAVPSAPSPADEKGDLSLTGAAG